MYTEHRRKGTRLGIEECVNVLNSAIPTFSQVFVVIDALDECTKSVAQDFMKPVLQLTGVRTLITSRHNSPNLGRHLDSISKLEVYASTDDVRIYLKGRIEEDSELADVVDEHPGLRDRIVTTIEKKCNGMFLLCRLHIASLVGLDNQKAVCIALDSLPTELFATYDATMKRIEDQPSHVRTRAKQVLLWISCVKRPMTVRELQHALAVELGTTQLDRDALPAKSVLTSICAGLVRIDKGSEIIRLVHETTQSYLEGRRERFFPNAQEDIAKVCLTYLSFDTINTGRCSNYKLFEARLRENALLGYAAQYWAVHVKGTPELSVKDLALDFLRDVQKFSCATEVMIRTSFQYSGTTLAMLPENWKDSWSWQRDATWVSNLHLCSIFGLKEILSDLLRYSSMVDPKDGNDLTPLFYAVKNGHEAVVQLLLDKGAAVDSEDARGETLLLLATKEGSETMVKLLLDYGAKLDIKDSSGWTPLFWSARRGHKAVVKLLLDKGAGLDVEDRLGQTPLLYAAEGGHAVVVKLLLDRGARPNVGSDYLCWTPLFAANGGHGEVVKLVFDRGVKRDITASNGWTTLPWFTERYCNPNGGLLLDKGATRDVYNHWTVRLVWRPGPVIGNKRAKTPEVYIADSGYDAVVKLLLEKRADDSGQTVLFGVRTLGHTAVVKLLLSEQPHPDIQPYFGGSRTPLAYAAAGGHEAVVKLLLDHGAEPDIKDSNGWTPLLWAADAGHEVVVKLLLDRGANPNIKDDCGVLTRWRKNKAVLKLLRDKGAKLDIEHDCVSDAPVRDCKGDGRRRLRRSRDREFVWI